MNKSQLEHFILFFCAGFAFQYLPGWLFLAIAAILIELDQARTWYKPFYYFDFGYFAWFKRLDTWLDLAADALAIVAYLYIAKILR